MLLPLSLAGASFVQPVTPAVQTLPAAPGQRADAGDDTLTYSDLGERMTVPVTISGAGPYGFIVDTAAMRTVISRELDGVLCLAQGRDVRLTSSARSRAAARRGARLTGVRR